MKKVSNSYSDLIDKLLAAGIEPMITLVHFDMPYVWLKFTTDLHQQYVVDCFERYARVCIERFGDRVKHWMSFNEQNLHGMMLRVSNAEDIPEGVSLPKHLYQVYHNVFIAHCKAVKALRELQTRGKILWYVKSLQIFIHIQIHQRIIFLLGRHISIQEWFPLADVFAKGKYLDYMVAYLENRGWMPHFEEGDEELLKYTVDYIAFSYYSSNTVTEGEFDYERPCHEVVNEHVVKNPNCEANEWGWEIDPVGFRWTLNDLATRSDLPVFILENGIGWREDMTQEEVDAMLAAGKTIEDDFRINYHRDHIQAMKDAMIEDGVKCLGYITWGPIDILASMCNMDKRYGFVYVNRTNKDMRDLKRIPEKIIQMDQKGI